MRVLWAYMLMRPKTRLAYRGDLALETAGHAVVTTVGLFLVMTIYHHVPEVRGWDVHEVLLCWGMAEASLGLFLVAFQGLYHANRQYVVGGDLDRVLLRPVPPYVQILLDHVNPFALPVVLLGLAVVAVGAAGLGVPWGPVRWLLLPVMVASGALVVGGVLTGVSAVGFWMHHQGTAVGMAYQLTVFARYPLDFLPAPVVAVLVTALPFAFVGFVPATLFMDRPGWWPLALAQPVVGVAAMAAGYGLWRRGLRRYASSGH